MNDIIGYNPADLNSADRSNALYLACYGNELICPAGADKDRVEESLLFWPAEARRLVDGVLAEHYVGDYGGRPCWVWDLAEPQLSFERYESRGLRGLLGQDELFQFSGRALQLVKWYRSHRFCGQCGQPTQLLPGESALGCEHCGLSNYPRISPCAIMLITRDDHCLLARHGRSPGYHSCLAGFVEAGESVEQTVRRECMEEVGIEIGELHYFGSQPWPFPGQLMLGFHAEYRSGVIVPDGVEIVDADWFRYDQLPIIPGTFSVSGQLIEDFVDRCRQR